MKDLNASIFQGVILNDEGEAIEVCNVVLWSDISNPYLTSLLVSSSDCYLDLLLILYLTNSTNLQILRRQCCLLKDHLQTQGFFTKYSHEANPMA